MKTTITLKVSKEVETEDPDEATEELTKKLEADGWNVAVEVDDVEDDEDDEEDDGDEANDDVE